MRFKANIQNLTVFTKFIASVASLGPIAWAKLSESDVRFTVIPEQGTQVWAVLAINSVFDEYTIESNANNVINLEVALQPLHKALKSASQATSATIRLTKKDNTPFLSLTINSNPPNSSGNPTSRLSSTLDDHDLPAPTEATNHAEPTNIDLSALHRERKLVITQDIPVRVLAPPTVAGLHEPHCRESDVHIILPPLSQLKTVSDRFTKLALEDHQGSRSGLTGGTGSGARLELAANMHGCLKLRVCTDAMSIESCWTGLNNPELDPSQVDGGSQGLRDHPSERMKLLGGPDGKSEEGWAKVRVDGKDWGKVLSVGRLGGRVIACFCDDHALIVYVYLEDGSSVLTYYISSFSA